MGTALAMMGRKVLVSDAVDDPITRKLPIELTLYVIVGIQHYERGLMWAETYQSGHMEPEFQPRVAYRHLQWVLNHTQTL